MCWFVSCSPALWVSASPLPFFLSCFPLNPSPTQRVLSKKRGSQHEMSSFCGRDFNTSINWRFFRFKDKAWRYLILSVMSTDLSSGPQPAVGSHISQHASCVWLWAPHLRLLLRTQNVNLEKRDTYFYFHLEVEAPLGCSVPCPPPSTTWA